ncbi:Zn-dependent protease (plasmid) [Thermus thermophilus]|uniref:M48 family metallopeptidase n=1 Tax=Thermus thermophilus TaxID=274 RepID=UPI00192D0C87|nr:M48 family metallopeptidase [Thermus thermophilus]BCP99196.1 Zn-dependent protease [Thermus thermophilus]BCQ01498.1 Zn-dependent protease [Thermus thermophilus]
MVSVPTKLYAHPEDQKLLQALTSVGALQNLVERVLQLGETGYRVFLLSEAVKVGPKQFPEIYQIAVHAAEKLGLSVLPDLFVTPDLEANAFALGVKRPFVVIHQGLLNLFETDELAFTIGHEFGHLAAGHGVCKTIAQVAVEGTSSVASSALAGFFFGWILAEVSQGALWASLFRWYRAGEHTADRAGALVALDYGDKKTPIRALAKLTLKSLAGQVDLDEWVRQGRELKTLGQDALEKAYAQTLHYLNTWNRSHPLGLLRALDLHEWLDREYGIVEDYARKRAELKERLVQRLVKKGGKKDGAKNA